MLKPTLLILTLTLAACSRVLPVDGVVPAAPQHAVIAPDTLIDGYLIGLPDPVCEKLGNPECAKILDLVKTKGLDTAAGRALIADCSLSKAECERFTGLPARVGFSKQNGIAEVVGLAEEAMLAKWPFLDPAAIVGIGLYSESETGWIDPNGKHLRTRTAPYTLVVFDFADGSRHVAGVVCSTGECSAHGPDDPNASPPVDVVSSAGIALAIAFVTSRPHRVTILLEAFVEAQFD